jgi:hypothetical protein
MMENFMKNTICLVFLGLVLAGVSVTGMAGGGQGNADIDRIAAGVALASFQAEIKDEQQLRKHLTKQGSPIHALSASGKREFLSGLKFSSSGLASMNNTALIKELDESQIYAILKLFGVQFESSLISKEVFDAEDQLIIQLMGCDHMQCIDDENRRTCVEVEPDKLDCLRTLWSASCFSHCL